MINLFKKKEKEKVFDPDAERAIVKRGKAKGGGDLTYVSQEKYPIRGNPSFTVLQILKPLKCIFDKIVSGRIAKLIPFDVSNDKYSEPVQEIARLFDLISEGEKTESLRKRWHDYKIVVCAFLEHDIAYRLRFQWALERIDLKKIGLTDGDKYFFRVKNFWVELEEEKKEVFKKYPQIKENYGEFRDFIDKIQRDGTIPENLFGISMMKCAELFVKEKT